MSPATNPEHRLLCHSLQRSETLLSSLEKSLKIVYEFDRPGPMIPKKHTGKLCSERAGKGM